MKRVDGRSLDEGRPLTITPRYLKHAEGSVLIEVGDTKVICAATIEDRVPPFLRGRGSGWVTAEYGMLPRSSQERIPRESVRGKVSGRTQEIQRLVGRSLRAVMDLPKLGERTVWIDCDVRASRWRHAYCIDNRRVRRARARASCATGRGEARGRSDQGSCRRDEHRDAR